MKLTMRLASIFIFAAFIFVNCGGNDEPDLDDLTCEKSDALSAINITETTAVIIWSHPAKGGEETNFTVEYGLKGFEAGSGQTTKTNFKDIIIRDLQPSTEYQFYVSTLCENGVTAVVAGPSEFTTD